MTDAPNHEPSIWTRPDGPGAEAERRAAKAVCAHSNGGFCWAVGGHLGCKNGRGKAAHWRNCVANDVQLGFAGHTDAALSALLAFKEEPQ